MTSSAQLSFSEEEWRLAVLIQTGLAIFMTRYNGGPPFDERDLAIIAELNGRAASGDIERMMLKFTEVTT